MDPSDLVRGVTNLIPDNQKIMLLEKEVARLVEVQRRNQITIKGLESLLAEKETESVQLPKKIISFS